MIVTQRKRATTKLREKKQLERDLSASDERG
jgi:hypothetical protein